MKTIAMASDHAGYDLKEILKGYLSELGHEVKDFGTHTLESMDYPDVIHPAAAAVENGENDLGIVLCGSGEGAAITANKHPGIRAALSWIPEIAKLSREHNNANMLVLPARFIDDATAIGIVNTFLTTDFEGGRHQRRIEKIPL